MREPDVALGLADAEILMKVLHGLLDAERLSVVVSTPALSLARGFADRVLGLADGLLVFDGPPAQLSDDGVGWRFQTPLGMSR